MPNICGIAMCDNSLKHDIWESEKPTQQYSATWKGTSTSWQSMLNSQNDNEPLTEGCKVEDLDDSLLTYTANLIIELQFENVLYQKNWYLKTYFILWESENIWEKLLSTKNKFCLDVFHAEQPTADLKCSEL